MNGKGSTPRPMSVSRDEFDRRWEAAFRSPSVRRAVSPIPQSPADSPYRYAESPHAARCTQSDTPASPNADASRQSHCRCGGGVLLAT